MKNILTVILAVISAIFCLCSFVACGIGTQLETVHISTIEDLLLLSDSANKLFVLDNDIDCGGKKLTGVTNFEGNIDGKGHVIKNVEIISSNNCYGLISTIDGSSEKEYRIENLGLENFTVNITSVNDATFVGGLIGLCKWGNVVVNSCYTDGKINLLSACNSYYAVGGIIGSGASFTIENSYSDADITIDHSTKFTNKAYYLGGILGYAQWGGTIRNCYFSGSIDSSKMMLWESANYNPQIGSIVGKADDIKVLEYCVGAPTRLIGNTNTGKGAIGGIIGSYSGTLDTFRYNYYLDNYNENREEEECCIYRPKLTSSMGKPITNLYRSTFVYKDVWTGDYHQMNKYDEVEKVNLNFDTEIWQFGEDFPRLKVFNQSLEENE